ncbi:hypothetical protein U0070_018713 [Myodes glareolus]|uniref:Uncharacterized protein n=1 Tax=Myodes glareolus TaxID=447135 RepID=A0AAW0IVL7_MYOGA
MGGHDPASPQSPWSSSSWHDACTPHGRPSHDADEGSSSSWDDARGTCSWNEASQGWPHAHDARAFTDETSCSPYDGAHTAWPDSARQIRAERLFFGFVFLVLFQQEITVLSLGVFQLHDKQGFPFPDRIYHQLC